MKSDEKNKKQSFTATRKYDIQNYKHKNYSTRIEIQRFLPHYSRIANTQLFLSSIQISPQIFKIIHRIHTVLYILWSISWPIIRIHLQPSKYTTIKQYQEKFYVQSAPHTPHLINKQPEANNKVKVKPTNFITYIRVYNENNRRVYSKNIQLKLHRRRR